jgi:hypothetical protein
MKEIRLDGVEAKVSLDDDQAAEAVRTLNLADRPPWSIFFVEDVTARLCASTPLLDHHLIIRARRKTKGRDDVTVKFRPGRRSQLTTSWLSTTESTKGDLVTEFKVEEDWAGERRALSLSLTSERPDGLVSAVASGDRDLDDLLTADQKRLIAECAGVPVNLATLTMLPPVSAMRWPTFAVAGPDGNPLDVRAERWTVKDLDFLELSIAVGVDVAEAAQAALVAFVEAKGLQPMAGEAKTSLVLRSLVDQAACSP